MQSQSGSKPGCWYTTRLGQLGENDPLDEAGSGEVVLKVAVQPFMAKNDHNIYNNIKRIEIAVKTTKEKVKIR